jgi:hypothetical protein
MKASHQTIKIIKYYYAVSFIFEFLLKIYFFRIKKRTKILIIKFVKNLRFACDSLNFLKAGLYHSVKSQFYQKHKKIPNTFTFSKSFRKI